MIKPEIAIRADGNSGIGLGHIHRMLAFAGYVKDLFSVTFFCYNADQLVIDLIVGNGFKHEAISEMDDTSPAHLIGLLRGEEIIVLDGYGFKTDYQSALKEAGHRVIAIDDLNEWENVADVVINHAYSGKREDYKVSSSTTFYAGLKYAIIKQEILNSKSESPKEALNNVLVSIGGTDPMNYSQKIIESLLSGTTKTISVLTYPLNPQFNALKELAGKRSSRLKLYHSLNTTELIQLIKENDVAILQPSNIALEAAAIGIGMYLIQTAENQKFIFEALVKNGCAVKLEPDNLAAQVNSNTPELVNLQIEHQQNLLDGRSPNRIIDIVNQLCLKQRRVLMDDAKLIYDWNNDDVTRANSYNQNKIEYPDHLRWLDSKVKDETVFFGMFDFENEPAGCVRVESKSEENIIGITIAPEMRGKRLATSILQMACQVYFEEYEKKMITAYIKKDNTASLKSFVNAGFKIQDQNIYFGELSYKLIKHSNE